ncbi:MAG: class I SAM-dependent methyltransferase [Bacteroidia bacterium]|nr:class I SAM-dependent methyltransferase [Bacteroidia bacterium]MCC6768391.1 class I SAM-dependent methyltransferase [Bacteroidia bacterium]
MLLLSPTNFSDYELIDSGNFEKLERFGQYITIRPEPQALWNKILPEKEWLKKAHVRFEAKSSSSGTWQKLKQMPDRWLIQYKKANVNLKLRLALTSFKHVGVFPEQAVNWDYIGESISLLQTSQPRFLNLFAYTGAASLAARSAGADVTHVDSVKQVVTWANENQAHSSLNGVRWVVEDAMKFVKREIRRGNKYQGIIMDPPAYGHGTDGESWKLEKQLNELVNDTTQLLDPKEHFMILNTYSLGFSSLILGNLFPQNRKLESGELFLQSSSGQKLPLGVFGRFRQLNKKA